MPYSDPEKARAYQRSYRRARRAGDFCTTPVHPAIPPEFRLTSATTVLQLLEEQVQAVRSCKEAGTLERARVVGYLAAISLRAIEAGDMAARVQALETVLKQRNGDGT